MGRLHLPIFLIFVSHQAESLFVVNTSSGKVLGGERVFEGINKNGTYYSFQGIPYAEPPTGLNRFKEPVPVQPWSGVKDVSGGPPAKCPQRNIHAKTSEKSGKIMGKEDCLFLNIYSEELPTDNFVLRPVMFYIHGGGFTMGSGAGSVLSPSNSGEEYLLESGMVVVTINYRLGPLGFLAIEGTNIQGNQGLKDQFLALQWIKENIVNFGGDPGKITISGLSAGGISVHAHVLSPIGKDEDLFQGAISQSGNMLVLDVFGGKKTLSDSVRFFENLCVNETILEDLSDTCLFDLTPLDLIGETMKASMLLGKPLEDQEEMEKSLGLETYWLWPIVDDFADNPFLPAHPITILHNKQQKMVPYMSGIVKDEGGLLVPRWWKDMDPLDNKLQKYWGYVGAKNLLMQGAKDMTFDSKLKAKMIANFYVGKNGITRENKQGLLDMMTDVYFAAPNTEAIKLHAMSRAPVYNYLFTYKGSVSLAPFYGMRSKEAAKEDFGVVHADDIFYMFKLHLNGTPAISTVDDKEMVEVYQKLITNFALYGNPTPLATNDIPIWYPAQQSKAACVYLELNSKPQEKHRMFPERMTFWNLIQFKDILEKFAIGEEEEDLLDEIETTISQVEEDLEDESNDEDIEDDPKGRQKRKNRRRKRVMKLKKKRQGKWKKLKQKKLAKRKRLAKRLRNLQCAS